MSGRRRGLHGAADCQPQTSYYREQGYTYDESKQKAVDDLYQGMGDAARRDGVTPKP